MFGGHIWSAATIVGRASLDKSQEKDHVGDVLDGTLSQLRTWRSIRWKNDRNVCGQMTT